MTAQLLRSSRPSWRWYCCSSRLQMRGVCREGTFSLEDGTAAFPIPPGLEGAVALQRGPSLGDRCSEPHAQRG